MPVGAQLVLMLLFAAAGFHHSRHLERKYGRTAWGLPHWAWAIIAGFSLLLGALLLYIAERQLKRQPTPATAPVPAYGIPAQFPGQVPFSSPVAPATFAPGAPAAVTAPVQAAVTQPVAQLVAQPVPTPVPAAVAGAGWHPDPSGRHQYRWWDGATWTQHVQTNGTAYTDG
jgi:hypothetical protein